MIVVAGEALIDLVPQGRGALASLTPALGGGPYNTAVALGRLGSPTAFCSRTSLDAFGEALLDGLREAGVDVSPVQRGAEPTTLAVATIDTNGSAAYSFYVDGTADRLFAAPASLPPTRARCPSVPARSSWNRGRAPTRNCCGRRPRRVCSPRSTRTSGPG